MFEELAEALMGPVGLGILLLMSLPGGRQAARSSVKYLVKTGAEIGDYFNEIKDEVEQERKFYGSVQVTDRAKGR